MSGFFNKPVAGDRVRCVGCGLGRTVCAGELTVDCLAPRCHACGQYMVMGSPESPTERRIRTRLDDAGL